MMIPIYINRIFHSLIIISLTNKIKHNIINRSNINIKILCKQYKINKNPSLYNHWYNKISQMNKILKLHLINTKIIFKKMIKLNLERILSHLNKVGFLASKLINKLYKLWVLKKLYKIKLQVRTNILKISKKTLNLK